MSYGKRLARLRRTRDLSQEEFARRVGINRSTYARYETGKTQPDFDTLDKIAAFYDVSVDYLLGRSIKPEHSLIDPDEDFEGFFGFDLDSLSEKEKEELKDQLKKEVEFFLWQKRNK
ncbi:XRE family transcriptional regulator [Halobacillus trueperi]|uniref:XRE family transcriptional regulator n=1 Tax=Halobacillus trueperi TaxID=156205 RepID=A0A3D8VM59_9BACI|nr:helix-turn-helix transcriptional regulator [Halobacillus trueperi]RDY70281.1 XRE family transcriptional regulator [Halobacillus trueperi]